MNQEELQQKIAEYYGKLPPKAQEVFSSMKWLETLRTISERHTLNNEQIQTLGTETMLVLLSIIHRDEYENILNEELKLPKEKLENILEEINTFIINPIIGELSESFDKNTKISNEEYGGNEETNVIKQDIDTRFKTLSKEVQDIIEKSNYQTKIYTVAKNYNLTVAQVTKLEKIITNTILGVIPPDKFENSVKLELGLETEKIKNIVQEINEKILKEIRSKIMSLHGEKKEENKEYDTPSYDKAGLGGDVVNHEEIFRNAGIEVVEKEGMVQNLETPELMAPKTEGVFSKPDSIIMQKLSGSMQMPKTTTEYIATPVSPNTSNPTPKPKVDPYRMPIE